MSVRSRTAVVVVIAFLLVGLGMYVMQDFSTPHERCLVARAKIEAYESFQRDSKIYMTWGERHNLIVARVQEAKWCDHPLSREN